MVTVGDDFCIEERLFGLSPRNKVIAGVVAIAAGAGTAIAFWGMGLIWFGSLFCCLLGAAVLTAGVREAARLRRVDGEIARAQGEWSDLVREVRLLRRTNGNVARMLQQRGYREYAVRRWIVRECGDPEHGSGKGS